MASFGKGEKQTEIDVKYSQVKREQIIKDFEEKYGKPVQREIIIENVVYVEPPKKPEEEEKKGLS